MLGLSRQEHSGNSHRIHIGVLCGKTLSSGIFHDKAHVKICIVGHQHTAPGKLQEAGQGLLHGRRIRNHIVPNPRQLFDLEGDRHLRIDEHRKAVHNLTAADLHRADLYDSVFHRGKARGLNIEHHKILLERLTSVICDNLPQIVHKISLHPVQNLKKVLLVRRFFPRLRPFSLLRLPQILPDMICIGKTLHHPVIRNGHSSVPPLMRPLHNILRFGDAVHIAHLRVAVQLYSPVRRRIHTRGGKVFDFFNAVDGADGQVMVEFIQIHHTLQLHKRPRLQRSHKLFHKLVPGKKLYSYGIRKVRDVKHDDGSLIFDLTTVCL